jgi:hypothetical protein
MDDVWIVLGLTQFYGSEGRDGSGGNWGADSVRFAGSEDDAAKVYADLCRERDVYRDRCEAYDRAREVIRRQMFSDLEPAPKFNVLNPSSEWQAHAERYRTCLARYRQRLLEEHGPDPANEWPDGMSEGYSLIRMPYGVAGSYPVGGTG